MVENLKSIDTHSPEDQLMTFEEYAEKRHKTPYVFELEKGNKKIVYFGAKHSRNASEDMFEDIFRAFDEANPDIVFIEGMPNLAQNKDYIKKEFQKLDMEYDGDEITKRFGEPGFTLQLAFRGRVEAKSPEPPLNTEINNLLEQGFDKDAIFVFYLYRAVDQYNRSPEKIGMEKYLEPYMRNFKEATKWDSFNYSIEYLKEIGKKIWGNRSKFASQEFSKERVDPTPWDYSKNKQTVVNEIARQSTYFRDKYMIQQIRKAMEKHDKLFIVYGAGHAVMQEPAIRKLFETI